MYVYYTYTQILRLGWPLVHYFQSQVSQARARNYVVLFAGQTQEACHAEVKGRGGEPACQGGPPL